MRFPSTLSRALVAIAALCLFSAARPALAGSDKDWQPVSPEEISLKEPKVEKDADAEALFWDVRVDDSDEGSLVFTHYLRIKIFNERGKEAFSKVDIPFGKLFGREVKVKDIAARTIKADGSIVELSPKDIFEREVLRASGVKQKVKSFALPGIEPGVIIEYRWRESFSNAWANNLSLEFQREIPVERVKYYIKPFSGSEIYNILSMQMFNGERPPINKEKNGFYSVEMTNMPAFHEEPRMPPEEQVRSWMLIYYSRKELSKLPPIAFWGIWGKIASDIHQSDIKVNDEVKKAAAEAVGDATTPEDKLQRIDKYVRARIKNIYDDAVGLTLEDRAKLKTNKSPSDTLKRGQGTGEDIDMLFAALANAAGLDANIVEMGDRSRIFFDRDVPTGYFMTQHAIAVRIGDDWRFFDPASRYVPYGMLPWKAEGQDVLVLDAKKKMAVFVRTPISSPEKSVEKRTARLRLTEDGTLEGKVRIEYTGHLGADIKEQNDEASETEREETLRNMIKERMSTAEISDIKIENATDTEKPFVYEFKIKVPGYAQRTGKRLFIQPSFFEKGASPLFQTTARRYPIYFRFPWSEEDDVSIELPSGYALDNPEAPAPFSAGQITGYNMKLMATSDGRTLIMRRKFFFGGQDSILFPVQSYPQLKQVFDSLRDRDNHTIALKQQGATASAQ
jgi:transglutaminase-like putative cysteine protease